MKLNVVNNNNLKIKNNYKYFLIETIPQSMIMRQRSSVT